MQIGIIICISLSDWAKIIREDVPWNVHEETKQGGGLEAAQEPRCHVRGLGRIHSNHSLCSPLLIWQSRRARSQIVNGCHFLLGNYGSALWEFILYIFIFKKSLCSIWGRNGGKMWLDSLFAFLHSLVLYEILNLNTKMENGQKIFRDYVWMWSLELKGSYACLPISVCCSVFRKTFEFLEFINFLR